jgi:hypothetical protein
MVSQDLRDYIDARLREGLAEAYARNTCPECGMNCYFDGYVRADGSIDGDPWCPLCGYKPAVGGPKSL